MLTNDELQAIRECNHAFTIDYDSKHGGYIVSWCDDDLQANYEAEIPTELCTLSRADIPALLSHVDEQAREIAHLRRALGWLGGRMSFFVRGNWQSCLIKQCADDNGCAECIAAKALDATKEAAGE